jgi:hypothetical protein
MTMLALMGHMSRAMLERYCISAKRSAVEALKTVCVPSSDAVHKIPTPDNKKPIYLRNLSNAWWAL